MFLRSYRREDKRRIQQLFFETVHSVNAPDHTPEQLYAWAPAEHDRDTWAGLDECNCFVVERQKMLVGFAALSDLGTLKFLYVHQAAQGKGIGSALLKQIERFARKKGLLVLRTEACAAARPFFEKNGFAMEEEVLKMVREVGISLFSMSKAL